MSPDRVGVSRRQLFKGIAAAGAAGAVLSAADLGAGPVPTLLGGTPEAGALDELTAFPSQLTGKVVYPGDPRYDAARALWDGLFVTYPLVIVFCQNAIDVLNALTWARQNGVALRPRSGRHSLEGWSSVDGGVIIDVSAIKGVSVDPGSQTATVGAGLNQGEIIAALGQSNRTLPTGAEATVGVAGATLGGGIGFLSRSMGLSCDNLLGLDMVIPQGKKGAQLIHVDGSNYSDLLWASRGGGGGNFGIATSFTFKTFPLPTVVHFTVTWDWSNPSVWARAGH